MHRPISSSINELSRLAQSKGRAIPDAARLDWIGREGQDVLCMGRKLPRQVG